MHATVEVATAVKTPAVASATTAVVTATPVGAATALGVARSHRSEKHRDG
jgi:hypothetical protein